MYIAMYSRKATLLKGVAHWVVSRGTRENSSTLRNEMKRASLRASSLDMLPISALSLFRITGTGPVAAS